jgi:hypothetical protein
MGFPVMLNNELFYFNVLQPQSPEYPAASIYFSPQNQDYSANKLLMTIVPSWGNTQQFQQFVEGAINYKNVQEGIGVYGCLSTAVSAFCMSPLDVNPATVAFCVSYMSGDIALVENASLCMNLVAAELGEAFGTNDAFVDNMITGIGGGGSPNWVDMMTTLFNVIGEFFHEIDFRMPQSPYQPTGREGGDFPGPLPGPAPTPVEAPPAIDPDETPNEAPAAQPQQPDQQQQPDLPAPAPITLGEIENDPDRGPASESSNESNDDDHEGNDDHGGEGGDHEGGGD